MSIPIWKVKLTVPPLRPTSIIRPRLIERLNAITDSRLTLLSAPAGYGKTTLLVQWIRSIQGEASASPQIAWVTLDEEDNDPARFTAYLVSALQAVPSFDRKDIAQVILAKLGSSDFAHAGIGSLNDLVTALLEELNDFGHDLVLILDDYHYISTEGIHRALSGLVAHLPHQFHLVISTRVDPPLPLARLRAKDELVELRLSDLRFTPEEAGEYLSQALGSKLSAKDLTTLAERTEGWISGLHLAAVSLQGQPDVPAFIDGFAGSDHYVMDYLMQEVFDRQPGHLQNFLMKTSILHSMTGPLCDAVTGCPDSQAILESFERANLFIVSLDSERHWYRYHQLFSDLLQNRLQELPPEEQSLLHRRASQWFERNGMADEAIVHSLAAQDFSRSVELLEHHARAKLASGEIATVVSWMQKFPEQMLYDRPALNLIYGWALLLSGYPLQTVIARMQGMDDGGKSDRHAVAGLEAYLSVLRDEPVRTGELLLQTLKEQPPRDLFMRSLAACSIGLYAMDNDPVLGSQVLGEAARLSQNAGEVFVSILLMYLQSEAFLLSGRLGAAKEILQRALDKATDPKGRLPVAGLALVGLGFVAWERFDLPAAERYLVEGIPLADQYRGTMAVVEAYVTLAKVKLALGDERGAYESLGKVSQFAEMFGSPLLNSQVEAVQAEFALRQGNISSARHWIEEELITHQISLPEKIGEESRDAKVVQQSIRIGRVWARVLIADGKYNQALVLLEEMLINAKTRGMNAGMIEAEMLKALACQAKGDMETALSCLSDALSIAEPENFVSMFVIEGQPMARLLYLAAERGICCEYCRRLLAVLPPAVKTQPKQSQGEGMIEPLSDREREVLKLLREGLSNREIAASLVISLSTVKGHTASIFAKLNVHSRVRAVSRARELGLLNT